LDSLKDNGLSKNRPLKLNYGKHIEATISQIESHLTSSTSIDKQLARFISIQFLLENPKIHDFLDDAVLKEITLLRQNLSEELDNSIRDEIQATRNTYIDNILKDTVEYPDEERQYFTHRIDRILTNKYLGIPIFLIIMWLIFHVTFTWIGTPISDALDEFLGGTFTDTVSNLMDKLGLVPFLQDLINDGIIAGVGAVLVFVPQILVLFFFISLLEDSGYMSRIAILMDRIM
ncbi:ferrous iron transporter B, partial [Staphylococcus sp. SNAZ 59]